MYRKEFPSIVESIEDLQALLEHECGARLRSRLYLLILIRSGQVQTSPERLSSNHGFASGQHDVILAAASSPSESSLTRRC